MQYLAKVLRTSVLAGKIRAHACFALSRVFLACTVVLILAMPWMEYFWHFDRFLRGGQDFELGLLAVLTSFCLVLLLFQLGVNSLQFALALRRSLVRVLRTGRPVAMASSRAGLILLLHGVPLSGTTLGNYSLPLQI